MDAYQKIREQMERSFGSGRPTMLGRVTEVDEESRTCTVDDDGAVYFNVRLQCVTGGGAGLVLFPAEGAYVLAVRVEKSEQWVVMCASEIDSWRMDIGDRSVEMDGEAIVFNGGGLGLVKVDKMVEWMESVHSDMQTLITLLGTSPVAGGGAALGITFTPATPKPVRGDFEDTTIKH